MQCSICENSYFQSCISLSKNIFDLIHSCDSVSWFCNHCIYAISGVNKLVVRLGNVETNVQFLKDRVETLESRGTVTDDKIKHLENEGLAKNREVEARRLNLICLNLPESKKEDSKVRQEEVHDFLIKVLENQMEIDMEVINVTKLVRLCKKETARPIRFSVGVFEQMSYKTNLESQHKVEKEY